MLRTEKGGAYQQVRVITDTTLSVKDILCELLIEDVRNKKDELGYAQFISQLHSLILSQSS